MCVRERFTDSDTSNLAVKTSRTAFKHRLTVILFPANVSSALETTPPCNYAAIHNRASLFTCPRQPPGHDRTKHKVLLAGWRVPPSLTRVWPVLSKLCLPRSKTSSIHHVLPLTCHICLPRLHQAGPICLADTSAAAGGGVAGVFIISVSTDHCKGFANLPLESPIFLPSRVSLCALAQEHLPRCDLGFLLLSVLCD